MSKQSKGSLYFLRNNKKWQMPKSSDIHIETFCKLDIDEVLSYFAFAIGALVILLR